MTAAIVIPWRDSGDPHRQANLTRVLDHLSPLGLPLILADDGSESGPFNRSAAYNHGRELAISKHGADCYVWHEADMIVPLDQLDDAIAYAEKRHGLVVPFTRYRYLGEEASRLALSGVNVDTLYPQWVMENGSAVGAVGVCSEATMRAIGQWDEKFSGHGYDDRAMFAAFKAACGQVVFIEGDGTHLWHPMSYAPWERGTRASDAANFTPEEVAATRANRARMRRYLAARDVHDVRALTMEEA
jgi:hypothetical protein